MFFLFLFFKTPIFEKKSSTLKNCHVFVHIVQASSQDIKGNSQICTFIAGLFIARCG
jgi:hypothetical protein